MCSFKFNSPHSSIFRCSVSGHASHSIDSAMARSMLVTKSEPSRKRVQMVWSLDCCNVTKRIIIKCGSIGHQLAWSTYSRQAGYRRDSQFSTWPIAHFYCRSERPFALTDRQNMTVREKGLRQKWLQLRSHLIANVQICQVKLNKPG